MAQITHFTINDLMELKRSESFEYNGSVGDYLAENMGDGVPFTVYDGQPCLENDITFIDGEPNIDGLMSGHGEYIIVETPAATVGIQFAIAIILAVVVVALTPTPELPQNVSRTQESPNNGLTGRSNKARPLQRIPDIKGRVTSIPDVIQPTYSTYDNHLEIEHGYYCVGRKQYLVENINDGDTPIELITRSTAGVYFPFNSPNLGTPDISVNGHISEPVVAPYRSNLVNGIVIPVAEANPEISAVTLLFDNLGGTDGSIKNPNEDWNLDVYIVGQNAVLTNVDIDPPFFPVEDISGTYEIISVVGDTMIMADTFWSFSGVQFGDSGQVTSELDPFSINTDYFYITRAQTDRAIVNIIAPNGLYRDNGVKLQTRTVEFEIDFEFVDQDGNPAGAPVTISSEISGQDQQLKGVTVEHVFGSLQYFRIRVRRTTPKSTLSGTTVDEIKLEDLYGILDIDLTDFGDVTTIQTITVATPFATAVKAREFNVQATEMLNVYEGGGVFNGSLTPNIRGVQSFIRDAIDPVIGNLTLAGIAADDLLALDAEIDSYFEKTECGQFSYTFDSTNISFQEYTQTIFNAIFCIAFRESGQVSALLDRSQDTPAMLFTHRSKRPNSETHSRNTNLSNINDGVEFTYFDPTSKTSEVIYIPEDKLAVNPKTFNIAGIRNLKQAITRANREFNIIKNKKLDLDITVTAEGRYLRPNEMFSNVKGSRVQTFDGEVFNQDGLTLTLSADVIFDVGTHTIFLKNDEGIPESIVVTAGAESNQVILAGAPVQTIRTGIDSRRTEFSFGSEALHLAERWIPQEIDISDKWFVNIKAINYDDSYYADDLNSLSAFSDGFSSGYS